MLASRIAGEVAHHEPGWRLPRLSLLARRYGVTREQVESAVQQLTERHLVRQLPDGQFYRASQASYHVPLGGAPGLHVRVTAVGGTLSCRSMSLTDQALREDVTRALGVPAGETGSVLRMLYTVDGKPAAVSTTYATSSLRDLLVAAADAAAPALLPLAQSANAALILPDGLQSYGASRLLQLGQQQPSPNLAGVLRLASHELATTLTARLDDPADPGLCALTVAVLRPELFRITVASTEAPLPQDSSDVAWPEFDGIWEN